MSDKTDELKDEEALSEIKRIVAREIQQSLEKKLGGAKKEATTHITIKSVTIRIGKIVNTNRRTIYMSPTQRTPQVKYRHTYTLLAWASGVVFLILLLGISILFPDPTPSQQRIWIPILALSAAAFATTITGILNVKAKLGAQLAIGATGALGVLVLFYLFNPAIL